jgi:hypothetical protein
MQHDIIDNRERKLAASVKPLLSESERAKFAVGYFFISGFKFIADELEKLTELRLLVGTVSDSSAPRQRRRPWITNRQKPIPNNLSQQSTPPVTAHRCLTNRNFTESLT